MENKIKYKDLNNWLKILVNFGWISFIYWTLAIIIGAYGIISGAAFGG